ncbi:hypothetical protein EHS13_13845 [Paenibacillus psychroresistens]|uniref:Mannosyl-glycoprotein endo-beta-N-acetylglucosamidase-like domain-containing protein n=1 Tax=Paenibacillus psychroresistens TaxID=1778678 RepID=A0A6B8RHD0_9BACL|nr:glucosaminidase domain-containing protein [Paenibacillus psychroresistens]QGQ95881.1 hypothetical protein EHS13_13845 [Paenibacillus psychroresistens]
MITKEFIAQIAPFAVADQKRSRVLSSITIAQSILESASGAHAPGFNLFGIKSTTNSGQYLWTQEYVNGKYVQIQDWFIVYQDWTGSIADHSAFLIRNTRYAKAGFFVCCEKLDYIGAALSLQAAGYATDPKYASKLLKIITDYNLDSYDKGAPMKYNPHITKERIVEVNGKLKYIPLTTGKPYATKATDVRLLKMDKSRITIKFVARKGAKVSDLVKEFKADYGFNFPFFDSKSQLPIGTVYDGSKFINGASGKTLKWKELSSRLGEFFISDLTQMSDSNFVVQGSPLVVSNGRASWDYYNKLEETAHDIGKDIKGNLIRCQRTFVGIDKNGDLLLAISDGRTNSDIGLTIEEEALYMLDKGAVMALNGDGGSSTILANQSGGLNQAENVGKNERAVHHAMLIFFK